MRRIKIGVLLISYAIFSVNAEDNKNQLGDLEMECAGFCSVYPEKIPIVDNRQQCWCVFPEERFRGEK